jgi:hypothetical protein
MKEAATALRTKVRKEEGAMSSEDLLYQQVGTRI